MRRLPILHPALALLLAALLTPSSGQATTATDLCAAAANPCIWSGNIIVTAGSTLDFGGRDLVITGSGIIRANGGDTLTIKARRVTLQPGTLGRIRSNTTASAPTINIEVTQDIILQRSGSSRGRIDVKSSAAGGTVRLVAGGNIDMSGEILAQGTTVPADGGFVAITAAGNVTLNGDIDASGGVDAVGGDVLIEAGENLITNSMVATPEPVIDARGGLEGGSLDLTAGPLLDIGSRLIVNGTGAGSDGGFVTLEAQGNVRVRKQLAADGSGSIDFGGFGGDVAIVAGATLTIDGDVSVSGGAPDGEGGTLDVFAGVDYVQNGRVFANGPGDFAFGGTVLFSAGRTATLNGLTDLHGGSVGGGGYLSVQTGKEVKVQSEVNANGDGGYILLSTLVTTPTGTAVAGPITVSGNIHANGTPGGLGGVNNLQGCDITVTPTGIVETTGDSDAENLFLASGKITVRGKIDALPGGANRMEYRDAAKAPDVAGATITPTAVQTLTPSLPPCEAPAAAVCGNNDIEVGEACDGGNTTPCDGCSATCQLEFCGNGTKECTEDCDDNNTTDGDGCDSNCTPTGCGNGIATSPEECDEGALNGTPGSSCTTGCVIAGGPRCGNSRVDPGETCDDNNTDSCDGCSGTCQTECGNGVRECDEQCDAGAANGTAGSSCSSTCVLVGGACLQDTDCDPAGQCAGMMCDPEFKVCVLVAPLACDDGNACNGTETCAANACVAGSAPVIDDGDACTDDTCDPATGVAHDPKLGFDSVGCRLDAFESVLASASATDASDKARAKFRTLVSGVRAKLSAARTASGKKKARMLKAVKTKLGKLSKAVRAAQKKDQIGPELAGRLTTTVSSATSAVQTLLVSP